MWPTDSAILCQSHPRSFILIDDNPMALEEFENLYTALRSALK